MGILSTLLKSQRGRDAGAAWARPNLQAPETLTVTSGAFADNGTMPPGSAGRRVGGANTSPDLAWSEPPAGTAQLLLAFEDLDVPTPKPAVHTLALLDPSLRGLPEGGLDAKRPAAGVELLRSFIGRGYHGPEPLKGHGPHRYVFQLFALGTELAGATAAPRAVLAGIGVPVLARGRLTGVMERR